MCVFLISPVPITEPLTSELIDTPVFYNLAPRPIKYQVSVPIPTCCCPCPVESHGRVDGLYTRRASDDGCRDRCHSILTFFKPV